MRTTQFPNPSRRTPFGLAFLLAQAFFLFPASAAAQGDAVVVIYNSNLPDSRALAHYYATRRHVPTNQVLDFDLPTSESMTRREFQERFRNPLLKKLEKGKLMTFSPATKGNGKNQPAGSLRTPDESKVRYAVLCYGVPLRIDEDPKLKEDGLDKIPLQLRKNEAAVDSELALLPVNESKPALYGPFPNPCYGTTNAAILHPTNGVLMVARLDGPSAEIARGLIDKAIQAEKEGLWGRAYFDVRGLTNGASKIGDDWIRGAAEVSHRVGFETIVDKNEERFPVSFPMSQIAFYMGWYEYGGQVSGPFTRPSVEFMPGAFAYHLHSFSAHTIRSSKQYWVGPFLEKGVTITMGCVHEPFLEFTPNVAVFLHRFIPAGFSFGEAAYACQAYLSWQTTVVGDPLYRPFWRSPLKQHEELLQNKSKDLEWSHLKLVNINLAADMPAADLIQYLEETPEVQQSAVLLEKLGDLYLSKVKFADAAAAYRKAVPQASSPQQKVRLMLGLARILELSGAAEEAYAVYQEFIRIFPEYPDLLAVYRKLLPLAEQFKKAEEKEQYQREIERLTSGGAGRS